MLTKFTEIQLAWPKLTEFLTEKFTVFLLTKMEILAISAEKKQNQL